MDFITTVSPTWTMSDLNVSYPTDSPEGDASNAVQGLISNDHFRIFTKTSLAVWLFIATFGIVNNVLNIRTFIRMAPDDSVTLLFLALAISDLIVCTMALGEAVSTLCDILAWDFDITWSLPPNIPRLYMFTIRRILSFMTIMITLFLAFQRCLCVIVPFRVKGMFTKRLTFIFLGASFVFALVPYSLYVNQYKVVSYVDSVTKETRFKLGARGTRGSVLTFVSIGMGVVLNVTAQVVINSCIIVMGYGLKKSAEFRKVASKATREIEGSGMKASVAEASKDTTSSSKERQALIQVAILSIIFVITNAPFFLVALVVKIEPRIGLYNQYRNLYVIIYRIMFIVEIINSSVNFFIYYKYNSKFRKQCFRTKSVGK